MNSFSAFNNDDLLVETSLRRTVSSPVDQRFPESSTPERSCSPWVDILGATGDVASVDNGDYLYSDESQAIATTEDGDVYPGEDSPDAPPVETDSLLSKSFSDLFSSTTSLDEAQASFASYNWAWVVADLVYSKYGEKMRKLRNSINEKIEKFRSHPSSRSARPLSLEIPDDEVSVLQLFHKT